MFLKDEMTMIVLLRVHMSLRLRVLSCSLCKTLVHYSGIMFSEYGQVTKSCEEICVNIPFVVSIFSESV